MHRYSWSRFCVTRQLRIQHHQLLPTFKLFYEEIVVAVKNIVNIISHTFCLSIFAYSWSLLFFIITRWIFCTNVSIFYRIPSANRFGRDLLFVFMLLFLLMVACYIIWFTFYFILWILCFPAACGKVFDCSSSWCFGGDLLFLLIFLILPVAYCCLLFDLFFYQFGIFQQHSMVKSCAI